MLKFLHIRNFAIIEHLELEFFSGLSVLTGETGAGKSIIIDAIGLVLGDRADVNSIRPGKDAAEIILVVDTTQDSACAAWLEEHEFENDDECILRRTIRKDGKSRAYINNTPVPLKTLKSLAERMINIYGQHAHQALMHTGTQRMLIDRFADHPGELQRLKELYQQWCNQKEKYDRLVTGSSDIQSTVELLRYQVDELEQLGLVENEIEELESKHNRLANAEELKQASLRAGYQLKNDEGDDIYSRIGIVCTEISTLSDTDKQLEELSQSLEVAYSLVGECSAELRNYAETIEIDSKELAQTEQRLETIDQIARKHKVKAHEILPLYSKLSSELKELSKPEYDVDALKQQLEKLENKYHELASVVSKNRKSAATKISKEITAALAKLGMDKARIEVRVDTNPQSSPTTFGLDTVEFCVQTNPGQGMLPLAQIASGGELSRISLAIQMIAVDKLDVPVIIFDEVDAGVGGATADVVGKELHKIGEHRQVLCVTHLPQVAANAHHHYRVNKQAGQKDTVSAIDYLGRSERIAEVARMLGGIKLTENTFLHAQEMLETGVR